MARRSLRGVPEEWREQGLSGQPIYRMAMGAAYRGGVGGLAELTGCSRGLRRCLCVGWLHSCR